MTRETLINSQGLGRVWMATLWCAVMGVLVAVMIAGIHHLKSLSKTRKVGDPAPPHEAAAPELREDHPVARTFVKGGVQ